MPLPTSAMRHRLQFAAAVLGAVGAVYVVSRVAKGHGHCHRPAGVAPAVTYVPAGPPILPRTPPSVVQRPPVQAQRSGPSPAFMAAVDEADLGAMERLFEKGMPLDHTLAAAAKTGDRGVVTWLLEHGADIHDDEADVEAPLLAADEHPDIVKLLLARGAAEPDLSVAAITGAPNAVARLLSKRASPNPKDGTTPLYDAITSTLATAKNKQLIVDRLLAAGADPNKGEAADSGSTIAAALATCAPPDADAGEKVAPCIGLVRSLAGHGARVDGEALTAVLEIAEGVREPVADALLAGRLEPGATAIALGAATGERDGSLVKKIASHGVAWSWHDGEPDAVAPLVDAIDKLDPTLVRTLLEASAPADLHLKDGRSPLGQALEKVGSDPAEGARLVELLVGHGANVNRRLPDGRSPLFAAAETGDLRTIKALLDHGARVNEQILDETALDAAERSGHVAAARVLHGQGGRRAKPAE